FVRNDRLGAKRRTWTQREVRSHHESYTPGSPPSASTASPPVLGFPTVAPRVDPASRRMGGVKYIVNVTGDTPARGLYDSFDLAKKRVRELQSSQFPATICEVPADQPP